jgi:hypothetical protein
MHKSLLMHCKISCWLVSVRLRNSIVDIQLWDELQVTCDGDTTGRISWYSVYRLKGVSKRILAQASNDFGFAPFSIRRIGGNRSMDLGRINNEWLLDIGFREPWFLNLLLLLLIWLEGSWCWEVTEFGSKRPSRQELTTQTFTKKRRLITEFRNLLFGR